MFNIDDIITTQSYKTICDYIYDAEHGLDNIPPTSVVHLAMDHADQFFSRIKNNGENYIIVSSHSDFGLWEQSKNGPLQDLERTFQLIKHTQPEIGYTGVSIPPPINRGRCNLLHKFCCKCYRWTNATFPEIPSNIKKWFITNNTIGDDSRLINIPFGILENRKEYFANIDLNTLNKTPIIYVNFADYTLERSIIKKQLLELSKGKLKGRVVVEEKEIRFEEYLANIKKYLFVLSLEGNGIDGYRNLESCYVGSFPILSSILDNIYRPFCIPYNSNILSTINDCFNISYRPIDMFEDKSLYDKFKLSYWKNEVDKARELL
jgi:hypothetical protein